LIEVKDDHLLEHSTPFFASKREVAISDQKAEHYKLYRLYKFLGVRRYFVLTDL